MALHPTLSANGFAGHNRAASAAARTSPKIGITDRAVARSTLTGSGPCQSTAIRRAEVRSGTEGHVASRLQRTEGRQSSCRAARRSGRQRRVRLRRSANRSPQHQRNRQRMCKENDRRRGTGYAAWRRSGHHRETRLAFPYPACSSATSPARRPAWGIAASQQMARPQERRTREQRPQKESATTMPDA